MADIKDTVGETAKNDTHDVTLVQAMLKVVKNKTGVAFLKSNYDGSYGPDTKQAITDFQNEHKLAQAKATATNADKLGYMTSNGPTIKKLSDSLPADYSTIRVIKNHKTAYLAGDANVAQQVGLSVKTDANFTQTFRVNVGKLIDRMYSDYKIVLKPTPTGRRRSFAQQAAVNPATTNAGPGESNHQWGRAVDLGIHNLKWIKGDGTIFKDALWLNSLELKSSAKANAFWNVRDALATNNFSLHRLQMERIHLQDFNQATMSSRASLVKHLNNVAKLNWATAAGKNYKSNLGLDPAAIHVVGTAKQIWANNATVTKTMLAKAKTAKAKGAKVYKEADIKAQDIIDTKKALKADFALADTQWKKWVPTK